MDSKDLLVQALRDSGFHHLATRASQGFYDVRESPIPNPKLRLVQDLRDARTPEAIEFSHRVMSGEFDATAEEVRAFNDKRKGKMRADAELHGMSGTKNEVVKPRPEGDWSETVENGLKEVKDG
jgi:hypothetical protein